MLRRQYVLARVWNWLLIAVPLFAVLLPPEAYGNDAVSWFELARQTQVADNPSLRPGLPIPIRPGGGTSGLNPGRGGSMPQQYCSCTIPPGYSMIRIDPGQLCTNVITNCLCDPPGPGGEPSQQPLCLYTGTLNAVGGPVTPLR